MLKISYSVRVFNEWSHTSKNILSTINDFKRQQKLWHLYNSHPYFHQKYEMIKKKKENWIFDFEEKKIVFTWMTLFLYPIFYSFSIFLISFSLSFSIAINVRIFRAFTVYMAKSSASIYSHSISLNWLRFTFMSLFQFFNLFSHINFLLPYIYSKKI